MSLRKDCESAADSKGKRIRYLNLYTICVKEHGDEICL